MSKAVIRTTRFNIKNKTSAFTHTVYLCVSYGSRNNINRLIFVMEGQYIFCEVGRYFKILCRLISCFKRLYADVTSLAYYVALGLYIC
jgi:hypothetical protein